MAEYMLILVSTVLASSFILARFPGLYGFMGVLPRLETSIGMAWTMMLNAILTRAAVFRLLSGYVAAL